MPTAPARPCATPGCPNRQPCPDHARPAWATSIGKTRHERGYDNAWVHLRAAHLAAYPNCADCGQPATEVDHIIPLAEGGARLNHTNAASRCTPCHRTKTSSDAARARARRRTQAPAG